MVPMPPLVELSGKSTVPVWLWLSHSATITLPEVSTATPLSPLKSAAVPTPLEPVGEPDEQPPTSVMTVRLE